MDQKVLEKHSNHSVYVDTNPLDKRGNFTKHHAALRCLECERWLKWLSKQEAQQLEAMGVPHDL